VTGRIGVLRALTALTVVMTATTPIAISAQDAGQDPGNSASNLHLPSEVQVLLPHDPSVRKATAIVNSAIITDTDVDQRLALVLFANQGKISDEERERLRGQVLSNLIDETLQIQEAAANKITVDRKEIDSSFARVAQQFKLNPTQFGAYVRKAGSSEISLRRQIEGEMAWRRLLGRQVEPFVSVADEEVNQVIARMKAAKGSPEYHVNEIFVSATPLNTDQVLANVNRIVQQVRQGASFVAYARQYSEASTAAVGGDLGWVRAEQLPEALGGVLPQMAPGTVTDPIPVGGGFSIINLLDKRQVLTADPRDAILSVKQLAINFPAGTSREVAQPGLGLRRSAEDAAGLRQGQRSRQAAECRGDRQRSDQGARSAARAAAVMLGLRVGESTPPFGSSDDGVRALVLCGRDEPAEAALPGFEEIQQQITDERVNLRARRYLRDLRRDAVIEYR
jgi:peptidyl-prolyl cis-trans isomerase SurA